MTPSTNEKMAANLKVVELPGLFSQLECQNLIERLTASALLEAERNGANYQRSVFHDAQLAKIIEQRIHHYIPRGHYVSDRFRFSHYEPNGKFDLHQDGIYQDPRTGHRSTTTLSVFLNDNFKGGETEFFAGTSLSDARSAFIGYPVKGKGILFPREVYHRGNNVANGHKYLLRTDLMSSM